MNPYERKQLLSKVRYDHAACGADCGADCDACPRKQEHVLMEQNDALSMTVLSAIAEMEGFIENYIGVIHNATSDQTWIRHITAWVEQARHHLEKP